VTTRIYSNQDSRSHQWQGRI